MNAPRYVPINGMAARDAITAQRAPLKSEVAHGWAEAPITPEVAFNTCRKSFNVLPRCEHACLFRAFAPLAFWGNRHRRQHGNLGGSLLGITCEN